MLSVINYGLRFYRKERPRDEKHRRNTSYKFSLTTDLFLIHSSKKGSTLDYFFHPNKWNEWYFVTV